MISVIVPVHNTKQYIEECLDSIINQTYKEIEIICIDSSTDETTDILKKYAAYNSQIKHIVDNNSSYGYKLNLGFAVAQGEYIAIIDSDDYMESDMLRTLLQYAEKYKVDFVKSDYSPFYIENGKKVIFGYEPSASDSNIYGKVFSCEEYPELLYNNAVSIWTGLYRRDFIINNKIVLNESEGASFQDTGFSMISHVLASRIFYLKKSFYRYRTDNANSSVKSQKKNKVIAEELRWVDAQIEKNKIKNTDILFALRMKKIIAYEWNIDRLAREAALEFADYVHQELEEQYVKTGIVEKMPEYIRIKYDSVFYARERYENNHKELVLRIGKNLVQNENPIISVIIPVYNVEQYLQECLISVLEQSEKNIELICVNDGSTDHSLDILEEFASLDGRIRIINQENHGLAYTRNVAFSVAKGKYIVCLDGDDMFRENALEELLYIAEKNTTDIVYFDAECLFEPGVEYDKGKDDYYTRRKSYGLRTGKEIFAQTFIKEKFTDSVCLLMINREWLKEQDIHFYNGILYEDCLFSVQCMMKAKRVFHINQKFYIYRIRKNSIMTSNPYRAENLYSRAIGLRQFLEIYRDEELTDFQNEAFIKWIALIISNIKVIGQNIVDEEVERFSSMPNAEQLKFELALGEISWDRVGRRIEQREKVEKLENEKNIIIYGAGIRGKRLLEYFYLTDNVSRVMGFLVTSKIGQPDVIRGIKVMEFDSNSDIDKNDFVIISFRGDEAMDLKDKLEQKGYTNVMVMDEDLHRTICQKIRQELKL